MQTEIYYQNSQFFYPSELFTLDHTFMRHPVVNYDCMHVVHQDQPYQLDEQHGFDILQKAEYLSMFGRM